MSYIEYAGVFVCGLLMGVAGAIQAAQWMGLLKAPKSSARGEHARGADRNQAVEKVPGPVVKKAKRGTPWRKVKAKYEAEHRRTRKNVEERVREMRDR